MNPRWRNIIYFVITPAILGVLAVWAVLPASQYSPALPIMDASVSVGIFTVEALILSNILRYYRPSNGSEWKLAAWILLLAAGWLFASIWSVSLLASNDPGYSHALWGSFYLRFFIAVLVLTCLALVTWVRRQSESDVRSQKRIAEIRQLSREAELHSLRQQLQPHFLFNSLNSIQALVTSNPEKAKNMIIQLSDYLRGTLRKNHATQSVSEEIENARLYLEIERVRFGDRLNVNIDEIESCKSRRIPALILQPLLENAIKFGLYQTTGPVDITLQINCQPDFTGFSVSNPYEALSKERNGTGFGLSSLKRRLSLIYGRTDLVTTEKTDQHFKITLIIPTT